jgi:hypothetical protein
MSQSAPQRPVYKEPAPLNRHIYFGAVRCVTAIPDACTELLVGLLELIVPWSAWLFFALVIYLLGHCSIDEPAQKASRPVQALPRALVAPAETHQKHRSRTYHPQPMPASSAPSAASSAR